MKKERKLVAIEVKYLDTMMDLSEYLHPKKINALKKTLAFFLQKVDEGQFDEINLDVVIVRNGHIVEMYHNVTNT
jgi:Holliday junction resolvase-like predicted endonuclease